jgi:hypothetical protein
MKKFIALALVLLTLTVISAGCTPRESPDPVSSDALTIAGSTLLSPDPGGSEQAITQTPTTAAPTTEAEIDLSERIAKLTKEDGMGDIYFGQNLADTKQVLEKEDISYEVHYWPAPHEDKVSYLELDNGTCYGFGNNSAVLTDVVIKQTYSGIRLGDPATKVTQTYGEQEPTDFNNGIYFRYDFPSGDKIMRLTIGVVGHDPNSEVNYIDMMYKGYH